MLRELRTPARPEAVQVVERFAANGSAIQVEHFLFDGCPVSLGVPDVIATCLEVLEAVAQAPAVEAEHHYEGAQAEGELSLAADPVLRGIYESDLRPIPAGPVELVEVFVASLSSMFRSNCFCLLCLSLSTVAETMLRRQSAARKADYRD
jgi:hypothetical protein